nr:TetR/AcrR family transcriptional regulator [Actinomycetota bacterium]
LTDPLISRLRKENVPAPELRAEVAIAALAGVALGRSSGAFDALGAASDADLAELTAALLGTLVTG